MKNTGFAFFCWGIMIFLQIIYPAHAQESLEGADAQVLMDMDKGVEMMNKGDFVKADIQFKNVLKNVEVVPADLCFYFGKNSYHLHKYKQSIDWLNKYIQLKGTSGQFFDQAAEYLELAKADYLTKAEKNKGNNPENQDKVAEKSQVLDCEKYPFVVCPVCNGTGVIVEKGKLGASIYKTCPYSDEHGRMTCENYKLYLKGNLEPVENGN